MCAQLRARVKVHEQQLSVHDLGVQTWGAKGRLRMQVARQINATLDVESDDEEADDEGFAGPGGPVGGAGTGRSATKPIAADPAAPISRTGTNLFMRMVTSGGDMDSDDSDFDDEVPGCRVGAEGRRYQRGWV
jgi:hypothetical protein